MRLYCKMKLWTTHLLRPQWISPCARMLLKDTIFYHYAVSCCKLNNTRVCDEHLLGQVSTWTGCFGVSINRRKSPKVQKVENLNYGKSYTIWWSTTVNQKLRSLIILESWNYSSKLVKVQVVINCQYSVAQICTWEDTYARV